MTLNAPLGSFGAREPGRAAARGTRDRMVESFIVKGCRSELKSGFVKEINSKEGLDGEGLL